jgi:hypothetical protein
LDPKAKRHSKITLLKFALLRSLALPVGAV